MEIKAGDYIKVKGRWYDVWAIHPDNGIQIGGMEWAHPESVEEVRPGMVKDQLTPGPWRWEFLGNAGNYYLVGDNGRGPVTRSGPRSADGRLMEAAPELLEALKMCLAAATVYATEDGQLTEAQLKIREAARAADMTPVGYVMSKARAAIAKAEEGGG